MPLFYFILFAVMIAVIIGFVLFMWRRGKNSLLHKLYFAISGLTVLWLAALMCLFFLGDSPAEAMTYDAAHGTSYCYIVDSVTNLANYMPVMMLLIALTFINGWEDLPKWTGLLFIIPTISYILVWTNPLHHLFYVNFSLVRSEVVPAPYFYVNGVYAYLASFVAVVATIRSALRNRTGLYVRQALLYAFGTLIPVLFSVLATFGNLGMEIYHTPLSYVLGVSVLHGLAIFRFHLLDIKPMAMQTVLNRISDGYLVLSEKCVVVSCNSAFTASFGQAYGISLSDTLSADSTARMRDDVGFHTLLNAIETCRGSRDSISYEQSLADNTDSGMKRYYIVEASALTERETVLGFVVIFKDITKLRDSMQKLQNSQTRLMEQERLAFLGQMLGGISHNLKTPIMSISGSAASVGVLIDEANTSVGDPEVTGEDYREIYGEMRQWITRIQEACTYMSDIITAVKGQATNLNASQNIDFTIDDVVKRTRLLLRHELIGNNCTLTVDNRIGAEVCIHGDINSLVQVVNNLVGNAIDAMKAGGGGPITIELDRDEKTFRILVRDRGPGISPDVKDHLFRQMVTSKGTAGSGLGIFMSNSFIKAKFDGSMWFDDNPGGGAVFGISIPLESVSIGTQKIGGDTIQ